MVQLNEELIERLDAEAASTGVSRSALIREAVEQRLAKSREAEITRQIVEGYTRIPQGTPDEWGDLSAMSERSSIEAMQRLDAEESSSW